MKKKDCLLNSFECVEMSNLSSLSGFTDRNLLIRFFVLDVASITEDLCV